MSSKPVATKGPHSEHDAAEQRHDLATIKQAAWVKRWVVDVKSVGNGRDSLRYLARYVHRTAVSEERLLGTTADGRIRLNCQNSRTHKWRELSLVPHEFLRRWCLHILPKGFTRVRHYGFLSAAAVETLAQIRAILQMPLPAQRPKSSPAALPECACCKQPMRLLGTFTRHGDWLPAPADLFQLWLAILKAKHARASPLKPQTG